MRSFIQRLLTLIALYLASTFVVSGEIEHPSTDKLSGYIEKHCRQNCIDPAVLHFGVEAVADELDVNPVVLLAIVKVESNFRIKAVNTKNGKSAGLMQIQVRWHKDKFRGKNHLDIMDNLRVGAMVYRDCAKKHNGNREKALLCYNGYQRNGMKTYVPKVLQAYKELEQMDLQFS